MTIDNDFDYDNIAPHLIPPGGKISYGKNADGTYSPIGTTAGAVTANADAKANAADQSLSEGSFNALSTDLAGYLRTKAKQSGVWTVGFDQITLSANWTNGTNWPLVVAVNTGGADNTTPRFVAAQNPSSSSSIGITPVVSAALESSHVLKAGAGNLYSCYVTTGGTPGWLLIFNATSAPVDGAVTPIEAIQAPANSTVGWDCGDAPPDVYSTGITAVFSSTGPFTKTASATAFFKGRVV